MAGRTAYVTFRVSRIPGNVTDVSLVDIIRDCLAATESSIDIHVRSLAPYPDEREVEDLQIATIEFRELPRLFQDPSRNQWNLSARSHSCQLTFDTHFLGLTPLNSITRSKHDVDCVAISGLAGHPFGSWRQRNDLPGNPQFMWLQDLLPLCFPTIRVLTYGYNTDLVASESVQKVDELALSFIQHLKTIDSSGSPSRPLIFLAHSLGGLIVKRAMVYLAESNEAATHILDRVQMIILFGVPNRGMYVKHLQTMVEGQPNQRLISDLSVDSSYLTLLDDSFTGIVSRRQVRIVSAFETKRSQIAELQPSGKWERNGPAELLVTRDSAVHRASRATQDVIPIDQDHSNIVKFAPHDITFSILRNFIHNTLIGLSEDPVKPLSNPTSFGKDLRSAWQQHISPESTMRLLSLGVLSAESEKFDTLSVDERKHLQAFWKLKKSLRFDEQDLRLQAIERAHSATFGWIFEKAELGFLDWVMQGTGIYWIRGKPGSGKSTMMKYLYQSEELDDVLRQAGHQYKQRVLWFFFNERGAYTQKTITGLLRTILYQLMDSDLYLAAVIFNVIYAQVLDYDDITFNWTQDELGNCFEAVLNQTAHDITLLLFLDALDEYRGLPHAIAKWLDDVSQTSCPSSGSRTKVKVCFSSREWDAFVARFHGPASGFRLQEYTFHDIQQYVTSRATLLFSEQVDSAVQLQTSIGLLTIDHIARLISKKAEGVFLWAKFAVDELVNKGVSITDAEALSELIDRLPPQLEQFYTTIIHRIPKYSRQRAFTLLEIVLRNDGLLSLHDLFCMAECSVADTYNECLAILNASLLKQDTLKLSVELHNMCAGLLECSKGSVEQTEVTYVQFIHKTAKDFIGSPGFPQLILGTNYGLRSENGHTWLMKYHLTRPWNAHRRRPWQHAYLSERTLGLPATVFIDSVPDSAFKELYWNLIEKSLVFDRFIFATLADLQLYVSTVLKNDHRSMTIKKSEVKPLHALISMYATSEDNFLNGVEVLESSTQMFRLLLNFGFATGDRHNGFSVWDFLFDGYVRDTICWLPEQVRAQLAEIMIEMGGHDPNINIQRRTRNGQPASKHHTALHASIRHSQIVLVLLKYGADPNVLDSDGATPLDCCVGFTHVYGERVADGAIEATALALLAYGGRLGRLSHDLHRLQGLLGKVECYVRKNGLEVSARQRLQDLREQVGEYRPEVPEKPSRNDSREPGEFLEEFPKSSRNDSREPEELQGEFPTSSRAKEHRRISTFFFKVLHTRRRE